MKRGRSEDGWERKRAMRWGNMMERQNRKKGRTEEKRRQKDGQTDMERHKTERTDKRMEPNERRRSVGPPDEREARSPRQDPKASLCLPAKNTSASPRVPWRQGTAKCHLDNLHSGERRT